MLALAAAGALGACNGQRGAPSLDRPAPRWRAHGIPGSIARATSHLLAAVLALAAAGALGACKGQHDAPSHDPPAPVAPGSPGPTGAPTAGTTDAPTDAPTDANLDACRAAAARVVGLLPTRRAQALLDACQPCGDWDPLLRWNTPVTEGGPSRGAIERAMIACHAFCEPGAKQRFLGTLDAARGQDTRGSWRYLGEICKAEVSAVPDTRYMGAPYFALDRIARALGGLEPALLAPIELPLPALSVSGVGVELPAAPEIAAAAGPAALTIYANQILIGQLPAARLSATGLTVSGDYPGSPIDEAVSRGVGPPTALPAGRGSSPVGSIDPGRLAAALAAIPGQAGSAARAPAGDPVALLAPRSLPAARIAEVVAAAGGHDLRLAVAVPGPGGWALPGTVPIALIARPAAHGVRIALGADAGAAIAAARAAPRTDLERAPPVIAADRTATAESLAGLLGALAAIGVKTCALIPAGPAGATPKP